MNLGLPASPSTAEITVIDPPRGSERTERTTQVDEEVAVKSRTWQSRATSTASEPMSRAFVKEKFRRSRTSKRTAMVRSRTNRKLIRRRLASIVANSGFRVSLIVALIFGLFGRIVWVLLDLPDDPWNVVLDVLMCIVFFLFLIEIALSCFRSSYRWSLLFWMDVIGTVSMIFEVSFLLGTAGQETLNESANSTLTRITRAGKLGARAGRLSKIVKCAGYFMNTRGKEDVSKKTMSAKMLSQRLMTTLSSKVAMVTVLLVVIVPCFQIGVYPEADYSMRAWVERLEEDYSTAFDSLALSLDNSSTLFQTTVRSMLSFYDEVGAGYQPYHSEGFPEEVNYNSRTLYIPGEVILEAETPARKENVFRQVARFCLSSAGTRCDNGLRSAILFNFTDPHRRQAAMDTGMIIFVVCIMIVCAFDLSNTLNVMVVVPLERMMEMVRRLATQVLNVVSGMYDDDVRGDSDEDDGRVCHAGGVDTEIDMLEKVLDTLAKLSKIFMQKNVVDETEFADMSNESKGVIKDMLMMNTSAIRTGASRMNEGWLATFDNIVTVVRNLPVGEDTIESWDLDMLHMNVDDQMKVLHYVVFDSSFGNVVGRSTIDIETFGHFLQAVKAGYHDLPYHNFSHACDVAQNVHVSMQTTEADRWVGRVEQYALLIAAMCHDLGHPGITNPFLVETQHEIAVLYNDQSPLENMHCSKLFKICNAKTSDVFKYMSGDDFKVARKVCISSILHTDNAHHFEMVREIAKVYEVHSELCELQATSPDVRVQEYDTEVLAPNQNLWLQLFLHLADVSNPLRPFSICFAWAQCVLAEFFAQGDEEKRRGLPVGMLNDRDKVNRPGCQHGFINFLVTPLVTGVVKVFQPMSPLLDQMAENLKEWRNIWVEESKPSDEEIAKKDVEVQKVQEQAISLSRRARARKLSARLN